MSVQCSCMSRCSVNVSHRTSPHNMCSLLTHLPTVVEALRRASIHTTHRRLVIGDDIMRAAQQRCIEGCNGLRDNRFLPVSSLSTPVQVSAPTVALIPASSRAVAPLRAHTHASTHHAAISAAHTHAPIRDAAVTAARTHESARAAASIAAHTPAPSHSVVNSAPSRVPAHNTKASSAFTQARLLAAHTHGHAAPIRATPQLMDIITRASIATQTPPSTSLPLSDQVRLDACCICYEDYFRFNAFAFPIKQSACTHCGVGYQHHPHRHACSLLRPDCWPIAHQQHAAPRCEQCGVCISQHSGGGSGNGARRRRARARKQAQSAAVQPRIAHMRTPIGHITNPPARIYEDIDEYDDDSRTHYFNQRNDGSAASSSTHHHDRRDSQSPSAPHSHNEHTAHSSSSSRARLVKVSQVVKLIEKGAILDGKTLTSVLLFAQKDDRGTASSGGGL